MASNLSEKEKEVSAQQVEQIVITDEGGFTKVISKVAKVMMPTVVHIEVTGTVVQQVPDFGLDPFRFFFGLEQQQREQRVPIQALGSGVIISDEGYIITNNHVVQFAETIEVEFYDGTKQKAKLIGTDPQTDLAVIKTDPVKAMKYASFGDSDAVEVGEWVVAIGSPRGLDWTVTVGIISAKHRSEIGVLGPTGYEDFIQTDAAINPGNSGGALIGLSGKIIGINSLIVSASQGSEGLGFAIQSNMAKAISESLIKHGCLESIYFNICLFFSTPSAESGYNIIASS